jgi:hypothetical protein
MAAAELQVTLDAVIVAVTDETPRILVIDGEHHSPRLPSGPLEPGDRTLDRALRRFVRQQAGLEVGYVEQLYTFGDLDRSAGSAARPECSRLLSIAYLALVRESRPAAGATWMNWYDLYPWEDQRAGPPPVLSAAIEPSVARWVESSATAAARAEREERATMVFGLGGAAWDGVRVLERYELLYELGLLAESAGDDLAADDSSAGRDLAAGVGLGHPMQLDHRRMVATALGRLRGKLTYRPVVFELLPPTFTLFQLQRLVEALSGVPLHKQNFRRLVEGAGLVEGTGEVARTGGRPAELFRFRREVLRERPRPGVGTPWTRS